jgi:1,4-dihydroxy-2-naphthoate octaprenyltransferase|tara:strand:+ start:597 stop:1463 length:867 start_codon:yes stop_codon:yes gene_type:complete
MNTISKWLAGARPKTWPAAIVPVIVGTAAAESELTYWRALVALVVSLSLQIGVNLANDYSDGIRGTDKDRVGPIRLVASGLASPRSVMLGAFIAFGIAAFSGLIVAITVSYWLIAVGVAAIAAAWFYTGGSKPYGYLGLGEVFVFVFFGLVASCGSTFLQDERITALGVGCSIPVGLFAVALLITNNLRDRPADLLSDKKTLAVRMGDGPTRILYCVVVSIAFGFLLYLALLRPWVLLGLLGVPMAISPIKTVIKGAKGQELIAVLGATGKVQMVTGLAMAVGLLVGK